MEPAPEFKGKFSHGNEGFGALDDVYRRVDILIRRLEFTVRRLYSAVRRIGVCKVLQMNEKAVPLHPS